MEELDKQIIEVVEQAVKREYNLQDFRTFEVKLNSKAVDLKVINEEGIGFAIKVPMDKALEYYYDKLIQETELDFGIVNLDDFKRLYMEGVPVDEMEKSIQIDEEIFN